MSKNQPKGLSGEFTQFLDHYQTATQTYVSGTSTNNPFASTALPGGYTTTASGTTMTGTGIIEALKAYLHEWQTINCSNEPFFTAQSPRDPSMIVLLAVDTIAISNQHRCLLYNLIKTTIDNRQGYNGHTQMERFKLHVPESELQGDPDPTRNHYLAQLLCLHADTAPSKFPGWRITYEAAIYKPSQKATPQKPKKPRELVEEFCGSYTTREIIRQTNFEEIDNLTEAWQTLERGYSAPRTERKARRDAKPWVKGGSILGGLGI